MKSSAFTIWVMLAAGLVSIAPAFGADAVSLAAVRPPNLATVTGDDQPRFLPPDKAFEFSVHSGGPQTIVAHWKITDGYYLYRQKFHFVLKKAGNAVLGTPQFPTGEFKTDKYFGRSEVYRHSLDVTLPVSGADVKRLTLVATYQGCADAGLCYPPITRMASVQSGGSVAATRPLAETPSAPGSEQDRLAGLIRTAGLPLVALVFLGLGVLLAFTPCVLPMVPILSGLIVGQGNAITTRRAFGLSLIYVLAMAVTYTTAGVFAALFGANLQAAFQNPWVLVGFSAVFVALALSMFGFYELQLPAFLQTRLASAANRQRGGSYLGVAVMGVLSALIVGPCLAAPLAGALLVIGQGGDPVRGGLALFALSLGMGGPLLVVGTSAGRFLPKAGPWMNAVKGAFGVLMLGVAIWFLSRILPGPVTLALWAALAVITAVFLGALDPVPKPAGKWPRLAKGVGVLMLVYGLTLIVGAAAGADDPFRPLTTLRSTSAEPATQGLVFTRIKSVSDLDRAVQEAAAQGRPVMLDFYADWCVSCKEMERDTFRDPGVHAALGNTMLLQADVTANDDTDQALLHRFGIFGPPSIMFFDRSGRELTGNRVVGYLPAEAFIRHVRRATGADSK